MKKIKITDCIYTYKNDGVCHGFYEITTSQDREGIIISKHAEKHDKFLYLMHYLSKLDLFNEKVEVSYSRFTKIFSKTILGEYLAPRKIEIVWKEIED